MNEMTILIRKEKGINAHLIRLESKAQKAFDAGKNRKAIKTYLDLAHNAYPAGRLDQSLEAYDKAASVAIEKGLLGRAAQIIMEKAGKLHANGRRHDAMEEYGNALSAAGSGHLAGLADDASYEYNLLYKTIGPKRTFYVPPQCAVGRCRLARSATADLSANLLPTDNAVVALAGPLIP